MVGCAQLLNFKVKGDKIRLFCKYLSSYGFFAVCIYYQYCRIQNSLQVMYKTIFYTVNRFRDRGRRARGHSITSGQPVPPVENAPYIVDEISINQ